MKKSYLPFSNSLKTFRPLKQYFIKNRWLLIFGLISLLVVDGLQLMIPLVIKKAIDLLTMSTATHPTLFQLGLIILGLALLMAGFRYLWRYFILGHSRKVEEGLRNQLYRHLQILSVSFYKKTKTGDIMARAINDINAIRMATGIGIVALIDGSILGLAAIGFMISINLKLTIFSLIPAPVVIILTRILTQRMAVGFDNVQKTFSDITEQVRETFSGIRIIKAYNRESWEYGKVKEAGSRYIYENLQLAKTLALFLPLMAILTNLGLAVVIFLGGRLTIIGQISTGDFVAFISYLNLLTWPMMAMGWVTNLIQRASASMRRINRILDEVPEVKDMPYLLHLNKVRGEIEIKGLSFRYSENTEDVLNKVHLKINAGETVAMVGRLGSGKSTLLHTIPRLFKIPPGTIFLDGHDILQIPLKVLRANIGFVTQETFIFSDTIRNNVIFGRDDISDEELQEALRTADIHEYIKTLNHGLDTMLGERGVTLSGGQKQRLTIARAIISNPPILILDNALSMLDTLTEEKVLNRIMESRRDKTNILVSHRVTTLIKADHIFLFEKGKLPEQGNHKELLEKGGLYAGLYEKQIMTEEINGLPEALLPLREK